MGGPWCPHKEKKKKVDQTYRVSWVKPKEHPYRLSALEISCSILQDKRIPACFPACDGVGGDSSQSKFWLLSSCLNLQTVKLLVFQHSFKFAIHYGKHFHSLSPGFQITAPSREFASQESWVYSRWRKHCHKHCLEVLPKIYLSNNNVLSIEHIISGSFYACFYEWYFAVANYVSVENCDVNIKFLHPNVLLPVL